MTIAKQIVCLAYLGTALVALPVPVFAHSTKPSQPAANSNRESDFDSEHLFGFTEGTDIGDKGDRELEWGTSGRLGKRFGSYAVFGSSIEGKFTVLDNFRIGPSAHFAFHAISNVPGFEDRFVGALSELSFEMKHQVLDRHKAPFGLAFGFTPAIGMVDEMTGLPADVYGWSFLVMADREIIPRKLVGAVNVRYDAAVTRFRGTGLEERGSELAISGAASTQLQPGVFIGGELRYLRAYDGLVFNNFTGHAVFLGPTFYVKLSKESWIGGTWSMQVAGWAPAEPNGLDLQNFERHQFVVRFGRDF